MTDETVMEETVKSEGFTLSRLIWRLFGRQPAGYVEKVLDYNRGLSALGPELPVGTVVRLPLEDIPGTDKSTDVVRLWD